MGGINIIYAVLARPLSHPFHARVTDVTIRIVCRKDMKFDWQSQNNDNL